MDTQPRSEQTDAHRAGAPVVVGVDGTRTALDAVRWAAAEARLRGVALQIVHAAPYAAGEAADSPEARRMRGILAAAYTVARRAEPGLAVSTRPATGRPGDALTAAGETALLLVVGIPNQGPYELLPTSIALDVAGRAPTPVAVIRGRTRATDEPVLVGIDDPETDWAALSAAFVEADLHGSDLIVLHATGGLREHLSARAEDPPGQLAEAVGFLGERFPRVRTRIRLVPDTPTTALLAAATAARLVVVGTRGRGPAVRALFGSHSRELLRHSPVPVLVVAPEVHIRLPERPVDAAVANRT
jgi:nucleotide-binding universal stress UspA family protein